MALEWDAECINSAQAFMPISCFIWYRLLFICKQILTLFSALLFQKYICRQFPQQSLCIPAVAMVMHAELPCSIDQERIISWFSLLI